MVTVIVADQKIVMNKKAAAGRAANLAFFTITVAKQYGKDGKLESMNQTIVLYSDVMYNGELCLQFPRFCLSKILTVYGYLDLNVVYVDRMYKSSISTNLELQPAFALMPYQQQIVDYLMGNIFTSERVATRSASCILKLGTGLGKTFIVAALAYRLQLRLVYIVPTVILQRQFVTDMKSVFENVRINTTPQDPQNCDMCVLVINTAISLNTEFYTHFKFAVYDEVHRYAAPTFREVFWLSKSTYSLGMSATPGRPDSLEAILYSHLGSVVDEDCYDPIDSNFAIEARFVEYRNPAAATPVLNKKTKVISFIESCRDCFTYDSARDDLIISISLEWLAEGRRHFIFSNIVRHVLTLVEKIAMRLQQSGQNSAVEYLVGGRGDDNNVMIGLRNADLIVGTYQGASTGTSFPDMTAAIFATPTVSNVKQAIGRITRKNVQNPEADKIVRQIIVIDDVCAYWCKKSQARLRERLGVETAPKFAPASSTAFDEI